jgi:hypothetical protein
VPRCHLPQRRRRLSRHGSTEQVLRLSAVGGWGSSTKTAPPLGATAWREAGILLQSHAHKPQRERLPV